MIKRSILTRARQKILGEKHRSSVLIDLINNNRFKNYIEIGVWEGDTATNIIKNCLTLKKIYLIDPYNAKLGYKDGNIYNESQQLKVNNAKNLMLHRTKQFKNITYIFDTSENASKKFKNGTMDIIFIDAQHTYVEVKKDISFWKIKVRAGGVLCGHDYNNRYKEHVVKAVDEEFGNRVKLYDDAVWAVYC